MQSVLQEEHANLVAKKAKLEQDFLRAEEKAALAKVAIHQTQHATLAIETAMEEEGITPLSAGESIKIPNVSANN